jgi:ATP synthase protein I
MLDGFLPCPYGPPMPPEPDDLRRLGERIDEAEQRRTQQSKAPPPTSLGVAFRFGWEMFAALLVGGGLGWGIDWAFDHWSPFHTRPWGMVVMFVLGAVAGIRNVMAAAKELNAEMARKDVEK